MSFRLFPASASAPSVTSKCRLGMRRKVPWTPDGSFCLSFFAGEEAVGSSKKLGRRLGGSIRGKFSRGLGRARLSPASRWRGSKGI